MSGLTDQGFDRKTRAEIVEDLKLKARNRFGENVNLAENSPLGILIQLFSWPLALIWMSLEGIYNANNINTATGQDLDNLAKNIGISRRAAAKSIGEVEFSGDEGTIIPEGFLIETDSDPPIQFETTEEATIQENGVINVGIIAVEAGSSGNLPAESITEIVNPISGVDEVINHEPTEGGRDRETDTEFRERYKDSLDRPGGSTTNSIRANVLEETESTACLVLENPENEESEEGLPPKSFETVVLGGATEEIANAIFDKKPAGIQPFGDELYEVTDASGLEKTIAFSYAESIDIYVNVEIKTNGIYPDDGDEQIKDEIIEYIGGINTEGESIRGLSINENVIRTRLISLVHNIDGVQDVELIKIGKEENLSDSNIEIEFREVARTEPDLIEVNTS